MEVWAAIDLHQGRVVTPVRGKPDETTPSSDEPLAVAARWEREGADGLHLVDLDAVLETGSNGAIVESIIRHAKIPVQFGGGLRSITDVKRWLERGVDRVVLGTLAHQDPPALRELLRSCGAERIVVAVDYREGKVVTKGWTKREGLTAVQAVKRLEAMHIQIVLSTAVELDGTAQGPDIATLRTIRNATSLRIIASGGVRNVEDIRELQRIGIDGVVLGRALYEGTTRLSELNLREA